MALNAGLAIQRCTDKLMEIIEREIDWWKRENEAQRREILQLNQDKDRALMAAQMAKEEAQYHRAEMERYKNGTMMDSQWNTEVGRLQKEVQSWKSKYELAARRQDAIQRRLAATHARFSHTIVPVEEVDTNTLFPATPTKGTSPIVETTFRDSSANRGRKYQTSIMFPTPALAAAAVEKSIPPASTVERLMAKPTSKTQEPVEFNSSHAGSLSKSPSDGIAPSATLIAAPTNVCHDIDMHLNPDIPSSHPPETLENNKKWCYCDRSDYGAMIMCSNPTCTKQWFHVPCTGLKQVPEGDWFCDLCSAPSGSNISAKPLSDT